MKTVLFHIAASCVLLSISTVVSAQCKAFTKTQCADLLGNYTSNGQYNGAVMFEGEQATMVQTFYSNQDYRLVVCPQNSIADSVYFEVMDYRNSLLYSSRKSRSRTFDFNVESTQQLKVRIIVSRMSLGDQLKKNGCVSVLVGFKNK